MRVVDVQAAIIGRVSTMVGIEGGTSDVSDGFDEREREERAREELERGGRRGGRLQNPARSIQDRASWN